MLKPNFNAWDIKDPEVDLLKVAQAKAIANQQRMLAAQQSGMERMSDFTPQQNISPLLGLVDQWSGSNLAKSYKAPESGSDRLTKIQALEGGLINQQKTLTDDQLGQLKAALADKKEIRDTKLKYQMHLETLQNAKDVAREKLDNKKGKPISPQQLSEMAALAEQPNNLDKISKDWDEMASAPGSGVLSHIQSQPANIYSANRILAGTNFGKAMLQSARSTEMINKHIDMLPSAWVDKIKKEDMIAVAKKAAIDKYNAKLQAFQNGGYNIGELKPLRLDDVSSPPQDGPIQKTYQGKTYTLKPGQDPSVKENWVVE